MFAYCQLRVCLTCQGGAVLLSASVLISDSDLLKALTENIFIYMTKQSANILNVNLEFTQCPSEKESQVLFFLVWLFF